MTDKRQKATKVKCKRDESLTKQSKYSSLEEAFEFSWSLFADEHNTYVKSTRRNRIEKFECGTHDYQIYYANIDLRHQYGIPVTESQTFPPTKHPQL